jgi:hypothetical protein
MNTHSKSSKQIIKITVENIRANTWYSMIRDTIECIMVNVVSCAVKNAILWSVVTSSRNFDTSTMMDSIMLGK